MSGPGPNLILSSDPDAEYVPPPDVLATLEVSRSGFEVEIPGPVQRAARLPDVRILRGLLKAGFPATNYIVGPLNNPWESALTNAILARLPEHVNVLLDHGANPNGFPDWCFQNASSRFIRGRANELTSTGGCYLPPRPEVLENVNRFEPILANNQTADLTGAELELRRVGRARFWAEVDFPKTDFPTNSPLPSLSAAMTVRDEVLYHQLVEHGADESAWKGDVSLENSAGLSSTLAVEPPLWTTIRNKDSDMAQFLLQRGHRPDIFPTSLVTRSWNAMMYAITTKWTTGLDIMASLGDISLVTPSYRCHLIHFAVATLDLQLIQHVTRKFNGKEEEVIRGIPKTALEHTLLHIASLPLNDTFLNAHSQQCYMSIHDFRTLDTTWTPLQLHRAGPISSGRRARGARGGTTSHGPGFQYVPADQSAAQEVVIRYLMPILVEDELKCQDIHGNTPLHYLASVRNPNARLIGWMRKQPNGEQAWNMTNSSGFSAQDLLESGNAAGAYWDKAHMAFWKLG